MKNWLKISLIVIGILLVVIVSAVWVLNEERPQGVEGEGAEKMTDKMLSAVNSEAWDSLGYIRWEFSGGHEYVWDRKNKRAEVKWNGNRVLLNLETHEAQAWRDQTELGGSDADALISKSWHYFFNDSFWLQAFNKVRDEGTTRELVTLEDGRTGLMVTHSSGGITPGDAYLWFLDENGRPVSWKIWVSIVPIGGLEFSWDDWQQLEGGAMVSSCHKSPIISIELKGLKGGDSLSDLGLPESYFENN